jgi:hypothetical protein
LFLEEKIMKKNEMKFLKALLEIFELIILLFNSNNMIKKNVPLSQDILSL